MYRPIAIEMLDDGRLRGYSDALGLYVCWEGGRLRFFAPRTESYLRTHDEAEARAGTAEARAQEEQAARMAAQARAEEERAGRLAAQARAGTAEARAEEERASRVAAEAHLEGLEAELRRLRGE